MTHAIRRWMTLCETILEDQPRRDSDPNVAPWLDAAYARPDAKELYLHGSDHTFDQFKQPKLEHGHLIFFSKLIDGHHNKARPVQAEYYGHTLYLCKLHGLKPFKPYPQIDPQAAAILKDALQTQWDYENKVKMGRLDYQDCYEVIPPAVEAGYNFFTIYEISIHGNSYAVTDPSMIDIVGRYPETTT